ncbi:uncharacterized protein LACBIDRAFT_327110 [Laccaria bicolor S238N-H82]|uniref:Predicted protein n=1 Tax=Laccaria bicolor (strain S238N-H82 / ATCC MYA-4686) TaxID=486041 RepID=B0DAN9_LACBS|nr:uncharacterized protein LACBIDRAFT_327110 [Laccaria bicolor S238N-H82]EDR08566.1 predicted protein [Laccaria bicolor S238N-H82]|eukprot:XP_001880791.1 predicted protein [Laccaria bicolor S238N-H82]
MFVLRSQTKQRGLQTPKSTSFDIHHYYSSNLTLRRLLEPDLMSVLPWHEHTSLTCSPIPALRQSTLPSGTLRRSISQFNLRNQTVPFIYVGSSAFMYSDGSPDCYGREHYDDGDTKWPLNQRDCEDITPYDALVLGELNESFAPSTREMSAFSLPGARANGRFAHANFTICPQWRFSKTAHLTFVLRRPHEQDINNHPLYWLWWDIKPRHFKAVEGSAFKDLGTLDEKIANVMRSEAKKLHSQVAEIARTKDAKICGGLFFVANWMCDASGRLSLTSFYYRDLVWHVASFQRLYLETLAMVDWFKTWEARLLEPNRQVYPVDESVMGAITDSLETAETLFRIGAPVWLVRTPAEIPPQINILNVRPPTPKSIATLRDRRPSEVDPRELCLDDYPDHPFPHITTASPRSTLYIQACQTHFEGFLGPEDPKPVVKGPQSGSLSVEPDTGPSRTDREVVRASPYSNPASLSTKAPASSSTKASGITTSVNHEKFSEIEEAFIPPQCSVWKKALQNVKPDLSCIKSSKDCVRWLFMRGTNCKAFTFAWLISRSQWLQSFTSLDYSPGPAPHTQHWRDFFYHFSKEMNLVDTLWADIPLTAQLSQKGKTPAKGGRKSVKSKQNYAIKRGESLKNAQATFFGPRVNVGERPQLIFWRDVAVMEGNTDNLTPAISAEILWNLFEQNFRLELRMVDQQVLPADWASQDSAAVRDELVRRIFPEDDDNYIVGRLPETNVGLVAENWRDRVSQLILSMYKRKPAMSLPAKLFPVNNAPKTRKPHKAAKLASAALGNLYTPAGHFVQPFNPEGISASKNTDPFEPLATTLTFENDGNTVQMPGKKQKQFLRWENEVLPSLMEPYIKLLHETDSLRNMAQVRSRRQCTGCIEMLSVCNCTSPALQLLELGFFPCAPINPSLAVDLNMLEFVNELFVNAAPNTTAWCETLEAFLGNRRYKLTTRNSLRRRFGSAMQWYATLIDKKNLLVNNYLDDMRSSIKVSDENMEMADEDNIEIDEDMHTAAPNLERPSDYLRGRCPLCFGGKDWSKPDDLVDFIVCLDACFKQKSRKAQGKEAPAPRTHPDTAFVASEDVKAMEDVVNEIRPEPKSKSKASEG